MSAPERVCRPDQMSAREASASRARAPAGAEHLCDELDSVTRLPPAGRGTYADGVRVREPVARPLDVVAVELLLSASQAFLAGVLLYLAVGLWQDRGIGLGSVAAVVILLGLAVGVAWLFWLLGGTGWAMAGVNVAAGLLLGAVLLLIWFGETFRLGGVPLLLGVAAAVYGVAAGVFLDSPRRWRWDQRERLRPGTRVPRVSPTTQALVAHVPRSLPRRRPAPEPVSELAARIEATPLLPSPVTTAKVPSPGAAGAPVGEAPTTASPEAELEPELTEAPDVKGTPLEVPEAPEPVLPTDRLARGAPPADRAPDEAAEASAIELPTMIEPKAQRSPWAWAAPPEWNRDEDDEPVTRSSRRS